MHISEPNLLPPEYDKHQEYVARPDEMQRRNVDAFSFAENSPDAQQQVSETDSHNDRDQYTKVFNVRDRAFRPFGLRSEHYYLASQNSVSTNSCFAERRQGIWRAWITFAATSRLSPRRQLAGPGENF